MSLGFSKISIKNVHKAFGENIVLDGLNLEIQKGQSMVIIGASGTGKSVLLKNIIGLLQPDQGSIKINGEETVGRGQILTGGPGADTVEGIQIRFTGETEPLGGNAGTVTFSQNSLTFQVGANPHQHSEISLKSMKTNDLGRGE